MKEDEMGMTCDMNGTDEKQKMLVGNLKQRSHLDDLA
jgi:hypothetical protein